jgi:prepilin-type N-terminal cleavage/methylation domain-containing protein
MQRRTTIRRALRKRNLRGFSLLELILAMAVLAIGLLGSMVVIGVASANNGSSKLHTTAKALAESTMEKIVAIGSKATAKQTSITDCADNTFTIETARGPAGIPLLSGPLGKSIDFSQPPQLNYSMNYVMCSSGGGVTYDVRWEIEAGPTPGTDWVTVSAKPLPGAGAPIAQLALPFTLRQVRGDH